MPGAIVVARRGRRAMLAEAEAQALAPSGSREPAAWALLASSACPRRSRRRPPKSRDAGDVVLSRRPVPASTRTLTLSAGAKWSLRPRWLAAWWPAALDAAEGGVAIKQLSTARPGSPAGRLDVSILVLAEHCAHGHRPHGRLQRQFCARLSPTTTTRTTSSTSRLRGRGGRGHPALRRATGLAKLDWLRRFSSPLIMLVLVDRRCWPRLLLPHVGVRSNGASRWISLGPLPPMEPERVRQAGDGDLHRRPGFRPRRKVSRSRRSRSALCRSS